MRRTYNPKGSNVMNVKDMVTSEQNVPHFSRDKIKAWSDEDDSEGEVESESAKHVTALIGRVMSDTESCDGELNYEELASSYKELFARSTNGLPRLDNVLLAKGLTTNLINISQLCGQGIEVNSSKPECKITDKKGDVHMRGTRSKDKCFLWVSQEEAHLSTCLVSKEDEVKLWHQKLGHLNLKGMKKTIAAEAIRGLPKLKIVEDNICGECQISKQTRMSHPRLEHQITSKVLELLHMDLMGPMQVERIGGKRYAFVVVDDFSRFTWVNFIREKSDTFDVFKDLCTQLQREKDSVILRIRSEHGTKFENAKFNVSCSCEGIKHEFSSPITPQQNGVVERKNIILQESAKVMLHVKHLPYHFWTEVMNTTYHVHNRVTLRFCTTTTLYEMWKGRKPTVKYFYVFASKCYILAVLTK